MASVNQIYWALSHRLRGIFTSLEGIKNLISDGHLSSEDAKEMISQRFKDGYTQIEELRLLLEERAMYRDKQYQILLQMVSQLHEQIDELENKDMTIEMILEELNTMGMEIKKQIEYNRNIERRT